MQLPEPYIYTSPRMIAMVDRPQMAPREGPIADAVYGYHSFWIAEVPFIPGNVQEEGPLDQDASLRITRVLERQIRFLYDLAQSRDHLATFEMRLVARPQVGGYARVGIAFLGKVFHQDESISRQLALGLWDKFSAIFPHEAPLSYPLVPVQQTADLGDPASYSFIEWFEPIPWQQLNHPQSIVELRKYEDWPTMRGIGGVLHARDYIPHPFVAALDYTAMARLFETLARQRELCMVVITLRPQRLADQETVILHELASWYQKSSQGETIISGPMVEVMRELQSDVFEAYLRKRAEFGSKVYANLVREQRSLFLVRLQVIGAPIAQDDLIEALGSEVMANAGNNHPSRWTRVEPGPQEMRWTRFNLQWLEFVRWGITPLVQQYRPIIRLRQLATVQEAAGAFRLPVAASSSGLAGLDVRDEPFTTPFNSNSHHVTNGPAIALGTILDRGTPTGLPCVLPVAALQRPTLLLGEVDGPREHILATILDGLSTHHIPWILLRGTVPFEDEPGSQFTPSIASGTRRISIDSLSGPGSLSALSIHPFLPPPGVAISTFLDSLSLVFSAAYHLDEVASILMRRALLATYEEHGWSATTRGRNIDLNELATRLETLALSPQVPSEIGTMLRARCVLPLRDIASSLMVHSASNQTAGQEQDIWDQPAIIEIDQLGSSLHANILQGSLWSWLALSLSARTATASSNAAGIRGIIILEDAHNLFRGSEDAQQKDEQSHPIPLLPLLLTYGRRHHIGTVLSDRRPDLIKSEIASKAGTAIITQSSSHNARQAASRLLSLSTRQQARSSHLRAREAIVASAGNETIMITPITRGLVPTTPP